MADDRTETGNAFTAECPCEPDLRCNALFDRIAALGRTFLRQVDTGGMYTFVNEGTTNADAEQKTLDVLRVLDWLADVGHKEVHLVAKGWGALPAGPRAFTDRLPFRGPLRNSLIVILCCWSGGAGCR